MKTERERLLEIFAENLQKTAKELNFNTISEYTLNQIILMYKKKYNPAPIPKATQKEINNYFSYEDLTLPAIHNKSINANKNVINLREYKLKKEKK